MAKSLVSSLSCAHLASRTIELLWGLHIDIGLGKAAWYIRIVFFSLAAIYCFTSWILWISVVRSSGQSSVQQEIEMTEKQPHIPKQVKKSKKSESPEEEDTEETEEGYEIDAPIPNYRQTARFLSTTSLLTMLVFFGTLAYRQLLSGNHTSSDRLTQSP